MGSAAARRLLIPETIQSSAMDCGPAVLRSLLAGFGVEASYGRLREACQTGADGTSIEAIEQLAVAFGLEAEEVMLPADHLLAGAAGALPAVVVVLVGGVTHFVVVWRSHGSRLQVMDPATGRRWPRLGRFLEELYVHRHPVAAEDWREWIEGSETAAVWSGRLGALGASEDEAQRLRDGALAAPGWLAPAALDAAIRLGGSLTSAGAMRRGSDAIRLVARLAEEAATAAAPQEVIPEDYWSVWPQDATVEPVARASSLLLRGAVLVRVRGRREAPALGSVSEPVAAGEPPEPLPAELAAAIAEPERGPLRRLLDTLRRSGWVAPAALAAGSAAAGLMVAFEALLLNGLIRAGGQLAGAGQLPGALVALLAFAGALTVLELVTAIGARDLGRHLEARVRLAFLEKIPRLGDRWFRSRLPSDLAERAHSAVQLRGFPETGLALVSAGCELIATVLAVAWLFTGTGPLAVVAGIAAIALPLAVQPFLGERELRMRQHGAALARIQLDSLLGLLAVRSHGAEPLVRTQHDEVLDRWLRAGLGRLRGAVAAVTVQSLLGYGLAAALVALHVADRGISGGVLLLAYWALKIPTLGGEIADTLERFPAQRSVAIRVLEPLGAPEEEVAARSRAHRAEQQATGPTVSLRGVSVMVGGRPVLQEIDLAIAAGSRVAVLGRSGSGKSTLLGLLLGFQQPASGSLSVDEEPLDAAGVARLRSSTAWVDPSVRLWNRSLLDNLRFGGDHHPTPLPGVLETADLTGVLETLPEGLASPLGEGGGLVSGGEGQRVRLGRALARGAARLVVLDEPFRGLDREQRHRLLRAARERWPRATLVCATHDAGSVRDFDLVVVLENGRIVESGDPAELATRPASRYARLVQAEADAWSEPEWRRLRLAGGRVAGSTGESVG